MKKSIKIGNKILIEDVVAVSKDTNIVVETEKDTMSKVEQSRAEVEKILKGDKAVYGINTGFGSLSDIKIDSTKLKQLQLNLIRSHSAGVGDLLPSEYVRAMMFLRAHNISLGYSGVRMAVIESLMFFINNNIIPLIPEKGSVGASGDLAPLAHLALCLVGEGEVFYQGKKRNSLDVIKELKGSVLELEAKEGLALINGTQFMASFGCIGLDRAENISKHADIIGALSLDGTAGTFAAFDKRISDLRPHDGQKIVANNFINLSKGSKINDSHKNCTRVQDPYSFRCIPQVHGAIRDTLTYLRRVLSIEINSVTDNPLVFNDSIISGGNFHGEPIAFALDFASIAMTELSSISERRTDKLLTPAFNGGLPAYLAGDGGLNSGFMIAQYTAASLINESRVLAHPSSIDNVPTSNNKEDHVSMGATGARKFIKIIENTEVVLAIELMIAAEACSRRKPLSSSKALNRVVEMVRDVVAPLSQDRVLSEDIASATNLIRSGKILEEIKID